MGGEAWAGRLVVAPSARHGNSRWSAVSTLTWSSPMAVTEWS
jgi:hypothetical protein